MKVGVDAEMCTGHGRCYTVAPALFAPDEEGYNRDRGTVVDIPEEHHKLARRAARVCPEGAIKVLEA